MRRQTIAAAFLLAMGTSAFAQDYRVGDLVIEGPVAPATAQDRPSAAGYMTIRNEGASSDRLVGGTADIASSVEVHSSEIQNGMVRTRPIQNGLEIPAGATVRLQPGGAQMRFLGLQQPLSQDASFSGTLHFQKAGDVPVQYSVMQNQDLRAHFEGFR